MDTIADLTGGKNFHNINLMTEAVEEAVHTGTNYYTVTRPPARNSIPVFAASPKKPAPSKFPSPSASKAFQRRNKFYRCLRHG
jgi:hypothetical protein